MRVASFEWNGDWSDESLLWTPALKAEVKFVDDKDDGCFWMVSTVGVWCVTTETWWFESKSGML